MLKIIPYPSSHGWCLITKTEIEVLKIVRGTHPEWHLIVDMVEGKPKVLRGFYNVLGYVRRDGKSKYTVMLHGKRYPPLGRVKTLKAALVLYKLKC